MGNIITFYSYKGGVGRSMALANIAYELTKKNFKILIIDWDLEAPGLEKYFSSLKVENAKEGLLQLLVNSIENKDINYENYVSKIYTPDEKILSLINSGRETDSKKYSNALQNFDWTDYFSINNGGGFLEELRNKWKKDFDFVLIDSRTGLSDSSGICTILMPDILIPMFTANYQSLFGIRDAVIEIQNARQKLEVDRMRLTVLPIPSRFGTRIEFKESQEWIERIADILKDFYQEWLPKWIEPKYIIEQIKVPQVDYFSFGEKMAVIEQGTNDPEGLGFIYAKIASLLASDFQEIASFVGVEYFNNNKKEYLQKKDSIINLDLNDFQYDVFISYSKEDYQWVKELFVPALSEYLIDSLGYSPKLFFDFNELKVGSSFSNSLAYPIEKSKTIIFVDPGKEGNSVGISFELEEILNLVNLDSRKTLFPITNKKSPTDFNQLLKNYLVYDFSQFDFHETIKSTRTRAFFGIEIEKLALKIADAIKGKRITTPKKNIQESNITKELSKLAKEYEEVRLNMPSSGHRTSRMAGIVQKIKNLLIEPLLDLEPFTSNNSAGMRLIAISSLQKFPDLKYIEWLSEHVGDVEKPFIGYQASIAIYNATRAYGKESKTRIKKSLLKAQSNILKFEFKDPNQVEVISSALNELELIS